MKRDVCHQDDVGKIVKENTAARFTKDNNQSTQKSVTSRMRVGGRGRPATQY